LRTEPYLPDMKFDNYVLTGPISGMSAGQYIMGLFLELNDAGITIIMVTHNPDLADRYSTRKITMLDGLITSDSAPAAPEEPAQTPGK